MHFTAYVRDDFIFAHADLDTALAFIADCRDPSRPEDVVIWQGGRIAAVCLAEGAVLRIKTPA